MDAKNVSIPNGIFKEFPNATNLEQILAMINEKVAEGGTGGSTTVSVGTTTTGEAGTDASVSNSGTATAVVLDFTIPRGNQGVNGVNGVNGVDGADGADGADAVNPIFSIGDVTQGATASVSVTGTYPNLDLNFVLVKGDTGAQGPQGIQGIQGPAFVPADGSIVRAKLETQLLNEIKHDQAVITWTGSQTVNNNVSFNIVSLLTNASITRNTIGLVLNEATDLFTLTARNYDENIRVVCRLNGTIGGTAGTPREFFVELTRPGVAGALLIRDTITKINDSNINNRQVAFDTYVVGGTTDLFFTQGFEIKINNNSTQTLTLTGFTLLFFG